MSLNRRVPRNSASSMTSSSSVTVVCKSPEQQRHRQYDTIPINYRVRRNDTNKPLSMKGHLSKYKLPFWVRLVQGNLQKHLHVLDPLLVRGSTGNASLDCAIPLQVLEIRRRKLIIARKMQWDRKSQDYVVTGKHLQIPIHFKGWFEVIPDDGRPVEYFDTIQGITAIKPKKFLVRTSTVGYELGEENGISSWIPHEISPGEVLTTGMVYMDHRKTKLTTNVKNLFKKILKYRHISTKRDEDLKYLQCFDSKGNEIMIPLLMTGVFSPIGDPKNKSYDAVYELKDLTLAFDLPVKAQLIYTNSHQKYHVPHGVLKLDSLSEDDCVVVSKTLDCQNCFELPLDEDLCYIKDIAPKNFPLQNLSMRSMSLPTYSTKTLNESGDKTKLRVEKSQIDLPMRVPSKDSKKQKSPGIIERLSTRKTKKERAALKALQEEGIFSSRLSKAEMPFDAFYTDRNYFENPDSTKDRNKSYQEASLNESNKSNSPAYQTSSSTLTRSHSTPCSTPLPLKEYSIIDPFEGQYAKVCKKTSLQKRDLPPVPSEAKDDSESGTLVDVEERLSLSSNDTLYEHLPAAPIPPSSPVNILKCSESSGSMRNNVDSDEDGYMLPSQVNKKKDHYRQCSTNHVPIRWPVDNKCVQNSHTDLATYANCKEPINPYRPYTNANRSANRTIPDKKIIAASTSDLSRLDVPSARMHFVRRNSTAADYYTDRNRALRNLDGYHPPQPKYNIVESRESTYPCAEFQKKAQNTDPNNTWRHHNMRRSKNAMEVFHFTDSFREVRPISSRDSDCPSELATHQSTYSINGYTSPHGHCATPNHFSSLNRNGYLESDPANQYFVHSLSVSGLSDLCAKQGDDSAISLCSKGEYGFQGGSDYSYSEYADVFREDGWLPPDNIDCLSVQDVSRSLRYIGMKDRVVKRFANEQIDGQMLASLDWKLLKDGFPELNTLEVKKIIDFINGWRPKKSMS